MCFHHQSDAFVPHFFGIMPHFYQYYLFIGVFKCVLGLGGGVGGILLFTFPHFHTTIVYFSGFKHTQANSDMQRCPSSGPLSSLSTRWDGTKAATERSGCPRWRGRELSQFRAGRGTSGESSWSETYLTPRTHLTATIELTGQEWMMSCLSFWREGRRF